MNSKKWIRRRKRLSEIIEVGYDLDKISRLYDFIHVVSIVLNLLASIALTYDNVRVKYESVLLVIESVTIAFFAIDYLLRLFTAKFLFPELTEWHALRKYIFSFTGLVDILSFLPYYLPFFFPAGTAAFRMLRIVRIFRLFRINAYYDSLHVITEVIRGKTQALMSSVFIISMFMIASSLCMYSVEHEVQPDVFSNAFSGIWWATSTLLTVGYGDIYPITTLGKWLGIVISFLGVGMVAIPTGIISAGFVEQYASIKKRTEYGYEADLHFIKVFLDEDDRWIGKRIADLELSSGIIVAAIRRAEQVIIPRGDMILKYGDILILGAEAYKEREEIRLKEVVIKKQNPWNGVKIEDLDISRNSIIVLVKRKNKALIPNGNMILREGDTVFLYTQMHLSDVNEIDM